MQSGLAMALVSLGTPPPLTWVSTLSSAERAGLPGEFLPFQPQLTLAGEPMSSGYSGGEAGCFCRIRVSQTSATICLVMGPPRDDD